MRPDRIIHNEEDGSVILEWQVNGDYYEIEVSGPFDLEWMIKRKGQPVYHYELNDELKLQELS